MVMRKLRSGTGLMVIMLGFSLIFSGGCWFSGAKKLLQEVQGGEGKVVMIKDPPPTALLDYETVQIESFTNQLAPVVPGETPELIHDAIVKVLSEEPLVYTLGRKGYAEKGSTLIIRGSIIHYQSSEGFSSVFSSYAQLISRVQLVDGQTGEVIGEANCVGFSKAIARSGLEELAEGIAEAIKTWLTTEPKKEKRGIRSIVPDVF
jgi:hypothetical protein